MLPKDYRKVEKAIRKAKGWSIERGGKGHCKVKTPEGRIAGSIPASASDQRALKNDTAMLRRAGLQGI